MSDDAILRRLIARHLHFTGSARAREILENWSQWRGKFVKVMPTEYRRALREMAARADAPSVALVK
jgi:glutamate synthase (NADPH/NADH) large chain